MLAVLPFENLTGDPDQEYIGDGMTEELITQLGRMDPSRLGVIARTSAMQFKKTTKRADQIGSELGVSHLLEGSVRTTGSRIRVAVQLIETRHETSRLGRTVRAGREETCWRCSAKSPKRSSSTSRRAWPSHRPTSTPMRDDIRRSRRPTSTTCADAITGRRTLPTDTQKAMEHFRRAIELDPSYAFAYSGLADTYILLGSDGFLPMREAYPLARTAALKALALDDTLGEAHNSLAAITADYYWDWAEADRHFKRAVDLESELRDGAALLFVLSRLHGTTSRRRWTFADARQRSIRCRRAHR